MIKRLLKKLGLSRSKGPTKRPARERKPKQRNKPLRAEERIAQYLEGGRLPWTPGYHEYKWQQIAQALSDLELCRGFSEKALPKGYGKGLDERVVEYPWIFPLLVDSNGPVLDAGSVLNFESIVRHPQVKAPQLTIAGLAVERQNFYAEGVSYQFCDLRDLPFRDGWFSTTLCVSTLEHVGMNNEIYGHEDETTQPRREGRGSHLQAVAELMRVTRPGGTIAITVPVGRYEDHGFFQQFNRPMIDELLAALGRFGTVTERYFRYRPDGWISASWRECEDAQSHNPQSGRGRGDDGAAHCRAVGCFLAKG